MYEVLARGAQLLLALAGAYVVALWFVLVVWTFRDIEARSRSVVTQIAATLLAVLFFAPGVLLYLILRPKETLDGTFQRSLEEEYLLQDLEELPLCQRCHRYVEDDFVLCPHCHAQLREPCPSCARLVDLRWALCPYCAAVQVAKTATTVEPVEVPAARWAAPTARRRRIVRPERPAASAAVAPDVSPAAPDGIADGPADRWPAALASPLTLMPGVRHLIRPTDRFRARDQPPVTIGDVSAATGDGTDSAGGAASDSTPSPALGRPLVADRFRSRANGFGHGGNGTANGHVDADHEPDGREPIAVRPTDPPAEPDEPPASPVVLGRTRRDRD